MSRERLGPCANPECGRTRSVLDKFCSRPCAEYVYGTAETWLPPAEYRKQKRKLAAQKERARHRAGGKTHVDVENADAMNRRVNSSYGSKTGG